MTKRLVDEFKPERIFLFGSYAWGAPNEDSDVDLLVIITKSDLSPIKRAIQARRCLIDFNIPKDVVVKTRREFDKYSRVHASLECEILERGKLLYG